jgi:hypothetical protein
MPKSDSCETAAPLVNTNKRYLKQQDAKEILPMSDGWFEKARLDGSGPPFIKIGRRVLYEENTLRKWVEARTRKSTSDATIKAGA